MSHDAFTEKLLDLAYGELSTREARKVEGHAASCEACRAELARIRETRRTMGALAPEPAPERGESVLLAAARERARAREGRSRHPRWLWAGSIAAVSFVVVVAVSYRVLEMRHGLGRPEDEALLREPRPPEAQPPASSVPSAQMAEKHRGREDGPSGGSEPSASTKDAFAIGDAEVPRREPQGAASAPPAPRKKEPQGPAPAERYALAPPLAAQSPSAARAAPSPPSPGASPPAAAHEAGTPPARAAAAPEASEGATPPVRGFAVPPPPSRADEGRAVAAPRAGHAEAVARYESLRAAGSLRVGTRRFSGCAGETWRKVERDPEGRVIAYAREGTIAGKRVRVEAVYAADGRLAQARAQPHDGGAPFAADALAPRDAREAALDAPPRCGP